MNTIAEKPIRILLYEDKASYAASFMLTARKVRIIVEQVDNVDDLLEKINGNPKKYQFIVLDARAYMHEGQDEGTEDEMNLMPIIGALDKLKYEQQVSIPYCVNTGFADLKLRMADKVTCPIFDKGNEAALLNFIWETYNNTDEAKMRAQHPEVFDFADTYFSDDSLEVLSGLFKNNKFQSVQISDRINSLNALRRCAEHLMDILHSRYLSGAPGIISAPASRLRELTDYFRNNSEIPTHAYGNITTIRKTASAYGSHSPQQAAAAGDYPTKSTITALTLGLADTFAWAKTKL